MSKIATALVAALLTTTTSMATASTFEDQQEAFTSCMVTAGFKAVEYGGDDVGFVTRIEKKVIAGVETAVRLDTAVHPAIKANAQLSALYTTCREKAGLQGSSS